VGGGARTSLSPFLLVAVHQTFSAFDISSPLEEGHAPRILYFAAAVREKAQTHERAAGCTGRPSPPFFLPLLPVGRDWRKGRREQPGTFFQPVRGIGPLEPTHVPRLREKVADFPWLHFIPLTRSILLWRPAAEVWYGHSATRPLLRATHRRGGKRGGKDRAPLRAPSHRPHGSSPTGKSPFQEGVSTGSLCISRLMVSPQGELSKASQETPRGVYPVTNPLPQ